MASPQPWARRALPSGSPPGCSSSRRWRWRARSSAWAASLSQANQNRAASRLSPLATSLPSTCALYRQAARRYGLDWSVLAGIGRVECDHGRDPDPSCGPRAPSTARVRAARCSSSHRPGRLRGGRRRRRRARRWDAADAIFSAANYLARLGRSARLPPGDLRLQPCRLVRAPRSSAWAGAIPRFGWRQACRSRVGARAGLGGRRGLAVGDADDRCG